MASSHNLMSPYYGRARLRLWDGEKGSMQSEVRDAGSRIAGIRVQDGAMSFAPGAMDVMMTVALTMHLDPVFVGAHHLFRFLAVSVVMPFIIRAVAPKEVGITVIGESGTGKEVLARRVHDLSPRRTGPKARRRQVKKTAKKKLSRPHYPQPTSCSISMCRLSAGHPPLTP